MVPAPTYQNLPTFGTGASLVAPVPGTYSGGYLPGQLFPAENENWLMNYITANSNTSQTSVTNLVAEMGTILTAASITPSAGLTNQVYAALNALYATVGALATTNANLSTTNSNLSTETTNRQNADTTLQSNINTVQANLTALTPKTATGVGQWGSFNDHVVSLPSGGTWAFFYIEYSGSSISSVGSSIGTGGVTIFSNVISFAAGFYWRIS